MDQVVPIVTDNPAALRYEAHATGELTGFVDYRWLGGRRVLLHTEVLTAFAGRGIGSALARHILDEALASKTLVTVGCPFIRVFVERHPGYEAATTSLRRKAATE